MKQIEVCLSPELIGGFDLQGKISVVVDVLRATSCMAAGLASGIDHIIPFREVSDCQAMKDKGYFAAGERNGQKIPGMDMGNSPFEYMDPKMKGQKVATTTTNGTKCIALSEGAAHIITGAFVNISAVERYLRNKNLSVVVFCAGWKGKVNLEDTLFAGELITRLSDEFALTGDSAMVAAEVWKSSGHKLSELIRQSEHARRLAGYNIIKDIDFCAEKDHFNVVPELINGRLLPA